MDILCANNVTIDQIGYLHLILEDLHPKCSQEVSVIEPIIDHDPCPVKIHHSHFKCKIIKKEQKMMGF